ncbi:hypothetical protein ACWGJP_04945 [Microbacterium sp. NPDC055903]
MAVSAENLPALLRRVDRLAAGRQRDLRAGGDLASVQRSFRAIGWILAVEIVISVSAIGIAGMNLLTGNPDGFAVWMRVLVVFGLTAGLTYFALRASAGWYWAYSRLRLFARIFPIVTLVTAAIPGLYPLWMVIEQIIFSLLMFVVGEIAGTDAMRTVFAKATLRTAGPDER